MKSPHSVSIAMATYNGARFIKDQLDSLSKQTHLPAELVVTDDGSTDETLDIVTAFAELAPFPVYIERNPERLGYRANFLKAAGLCSSDIIAFSDQDDIWLPQKLETCISSFDDEAVSLAYHNATVVTDTLVPTDSLQNCALSQSVNEAFSLGPWQFGLGFTLLFRRRLVDFFGYWPQSTDFYDVENKEAHDQWTFFLASNLGTIYYINEPLVLYRQHDTNAFGWDSKATTMRGKLENLLTTKIDRIKSCELSAGGRAAILARIADKDKTGSTEKLHQAAMRYRQLEAYYESRRRIYQSSHIFLKLHYLIALLFQGAYRRRKYWGVGPQALLRDIVRGIIFPVKVRKQ
jgi:glycosyltransferase involved in cell wall biosynthesis